MAEVKVDLRRVFSECVENKLPYCCVCLRTYKEVPLGPCSRTAAVSAALGGKLGTGRGVRACITCEAAAARALRFVRALHAAQAVQDLFRTLKTATPNTERLLEKSVTRCNQMVAAARNASKMTATDVLIIDSYGVHTTGPAADNPKTLLGGAGEVETVVLDDEEDERPSPAPPAPPPATTPTLVSLDALLHDRSVTPGAVAMLPDGTGVLARLAGSAGSAGANFMLHPTVVTRPDPPTLFVPSLGMQVVLPAGSVLPPRAGPVGAGGAPGTVGTLPAQFLVTTGTHNAQPQLRPQKPAAALTETHIIPDDEPPRNSPSPSRSTSPPIRMHNGSHTGNTHRNNRPHKDEASNTNSLINMLLNNEETQKSIKRTINSILKEKEEKAEAKKAKDGVRYIVDLDTVEELIKKQEEDVRKQPMLKGDKIDWEDKIPMDVISFMDATDPNAEEVLTERGGAAGAGRAGGRHTTGCEVSPFGVISDVRTGMSSPPPTHIIDLC